MRMHNLAAGLLLAALTLAGCSAPGGSPAGPEEQTLQGRLNLVDSELKYLIVIADDAYCRFDFSQSDADVSGLEPGDSVSVTYTGDLDPESEDATAQLTRIERAD